MRRLRGLTVCLLMFFPSQRESKHQPIIIDLVPNEERTLDLAWENAIKPPMCLSASGNGVEKSNGI